MDIVYCVTCHMANRKRKVALTCPSSAHPVILLVPVVAKVKTFF